MEISVSVRELLARVIIAFKSKRLRLNINQVNDSYSRADEIIQQTESVLDGDWLNEKWAVIFICLLGAYAHDRQLSINDIEDLSDRAIKLQGFIDRL